MIKKEYRLLFATLLKFVVVFLIADLALGTVSKHLFFNQETGKYSRTTYAINKTNAKILIFGSSHAHRHYVPEVFEKELNKTCYNAGAEGQQLLYHTALQKIILKRITPELIILNIDEDFLYKFEAAYDRLSDLHPYYSDHKEDLRPILGLRSKLLDFKLFFKSYQTNSTLVHAIRYYLSPQFDYNGYRPLFGTIKPLKNREEYIEHVPERDSEEIDENFVAALKGFISSAKDNNINLIFVTSPGFNEIDTSINESFRRIQEIADKEHIPLLNFFNSPEFKNKHELFHDTSHLNDSGARLFSKHLSDAIQKM